MLDRRLPLAAGGIPGDAAVGGLARRLGLGRLDLLLAAGVARDCLLLPGQREVDLGLAGVHRALGIVVRACGELLINEETEVLDLVGDRVLDLGLPLAALLVPADAAVLRLLRADLPGQADLGRSAQHAPVSLDLARVREVEARPSSFQLAGLGVVCARGLGLVVKAPQADLPVVVEDADAPLHVALVPAHAEELGHLLRRTSCLALPLARDDVLVGLGVNLDLLDVLGLPREGVHQDAARERVEPLRRLVAAVHQRAGVVLAAGLDLDRLLQVAR